MESTVTVQRLGGGADETSRCPALSCHARMPASVGGSRAGKGRAPLQPGPVPELPRRGDAGPRSPVPLRGDGGVRRRGLRRLPRGGPRRHQRRRRQRPGQHLRRMPPRSVRRVHQAERRRLREQARPGLDSHDGRRPLHGHARSPALRHVRTLPQHRHRRRGRLGGQVRLVSHPARLLCRRSAGARGLWDLPHGTRPRADRHVGEEQARRRLRHREGARRRRPLTRADLRHLPHAHP